MECSGCVTISTHPCAHVNNDIELSRKTGYGAPSGLILCDLRSDRYTDGCGSTARNRVFLDVNVNTATDE